MTDGGLIPRRSVLSRSQSVSCAQLDPKKRLPQDRPCSVPIAQLPTRVDISSYTELGSTVCFDYAV